MILSWQKRANRTIWLTSKRNEARGRAGIEGLLGDLVVGDDLCCCACRASHLWNNRAILASLEEQVVSRSGGPQA
jgi:hypothetical protein